MGQTKLLDFVRVYAPAAEAAKIGAGLSVVYMPYDWRQHPA